MAAALATPPADKTFNDTAFAHLVKKDDHIKPNVSSKIGEVSIDLSSFHRSLVAVLDALQKQERGDCPGTVELRVQINHIRQQVNNIEVKIGDTGDLQIQINKIKTLISSIEITIANIEIKIEEHRKAADETRKIADETRKCLEIDRHNASARNYNVAMDKNSDFLIQLKGSKPGKYFDKYIDGFPAKPTDINPLSDEKILEILDALSIEHNHATDPDLRFTNDPHWQPGMHKHHHGKAHRDGCEPIKDDFNLDKARMQRLRRQLRAALGLSAFQTATVTINAIDPDDI